MKSPRGLWKLIPSALYGYEECKACFWIDQHIGRMPGVPFRLNEAMDEKLKHRYDGFRAKGKMPPELKSLKGMSLFNDLSILDRWRNDWSALRFVNDKDGYELYGKIDEVLITDAGEYILVDFKSSGDAPKEDKQKYYRLQLHAYTLMLRGLGYKTGNCAYLVHYFTKDRKDQSLKMEFASHLDRVDIDLVQFQNTLKDIVQFLNKDFPGAAFECKKCAWHLQRKKY